MSEGQKWGEKPQNDEWGSKGMGQGGGWGLLAPQLPPEKQVFQRFCPKNGWFERTSLQKALFSDDLPPKSSIFRGFFPQKWHFEGIFPKKLPFSKDFSPPKVIF